MLFDTTEATGADATLVQNCNALLEQAGVTALWRPPELSLELTSLGAEVVELSKTPERLNNDDIDTIHYLGRTVVKSVPDFINITTAEDTGRPAFRAHTAVDKGIGNCIAAHEVALGIMTELGLGDHTIGKWSGKHASSGVVIKGGPFVLDSYTRVATPIRSYLPSEVYDAWLAATSQNKASLVTRSRRHTDVTTVQMDQLQDLTFKSMTEQKIILPGAAAVVMYCALASQSPKDGTHPQATEILRPYAPAFKLR